VTDYSVEFKVKNARIKRAIRECGYKSVNAFCAANGLQPSVVGEILNLKKSPILQRHREHRGEWRSVVLKMADALGCLPEDLFSESQRMLTLETNEGSRDVTETEMLSLIGSDTDSDWQLLGSGNPLALLEKDQEESDSSQFLGFLGEVLSPREAAVIKMRFYQDMNLEQIAVAFSVTRERIRQIEAKALRKIRKFFSDNYDNPDISSRRPAWADDRKTAPQPWVPES